jgi:hypothetical protein
MNPIANVAYDENASERGDLRKELRREHHSGCRTVDKEIVPLDGRADGARQRDAACVQFAIGCGSDHCGSYPI